MLAPNWSVVPSKVKLDSAVAVPSPSDVKTRLFESPAIELIATVTVLNVLSPAKNVPLFFVPLSPRRAIGTVPDERFVAFKLLKPEPLPENTDADKVFVA